MKTNKIVGLLGLLLPSTAHADEWKISDAEQSLCYETTTPLGITAYALLDTGSPVALEAISLSSTNVCYAFPREETATITLTGTYGNTLPLHKKRFYVYRGQLYEEPFTLESTVAPSPSHTNTAYVYDGELSEELFIVASTIAPSALAITRDTVSFTDDNALRMKAYGVIYEPGTDTSHHVELTKITENTTTATFLIPTDDVIRTLSHSPVGSVSRYYAVDRNGNHSLTYISMSGMFFAFSDSSKKENQRNE
ncbi:hypothetical protein HZC31_03900 [Candidatus Woesearchaeota archaeon]|nr:hypothetical protein [Candidatus Woesearchaeota archaeon]